MAPKKRKMARITLAATTLAALAACGGGGDGGGSTPAPAPAPVPLELSDTASLPADLQAADAAADCASLRSGTYRYVIADDGGSGYVTGTVVVDAKALTLTSDVVDRLTPLGNCRYQMPEGGTLLVSKAGVMVAQSDAAPRRVALVFPEQSHTVDELAGEWNMLATDRLSDGGPVQLTAGSFTFDATGTLTAMTFCEDMLTCQSGKAGDAGFPSLRISAAASGGGFEITNTTDVWTDRLFAYRAGGNELMLVSLTQGGNITVITRKAARTLPTVGDTLESWNVTLQINASAPWLTSPFAASRSQQTITAVDAAAGSYTRDAVIDFGTGATRPETLQIEQPRTGYIRRVPATVTTSTGSTSNVSEFIGLPLRGMGLTAVSLPGSNQLLFSVRQ